MNQGLDPNRLRSGSIEIRADLPYIAQPRSDPGRFGPSGPPGHPNDLVGAERPCLDRRLGRTMEEEKGVRDPRGFLVSVLQGATAGR